MRFMKYVVFAVAIAAAAVASAATIEGVVIGKPGVNIRVSPDANAKIVIAAPTGDTVAIAKIADQEQTIGGKRGNWLKVSYKGTEGWAFGPFVSYDADAKPTGPDKTAVPASTDAGFLITPTSVGPIELGMTLDAARKKLPKATFTRTSDGEGIAIVEVKIGGDSIMGLIAGEENADSPINWQKKIEFIGVYSPTCHTIDGVHPGMKVAAAEKVYGKVTKIMLSEIEQREFVWFANSPKEYNMRLDSCGVFKGEETHTTKYKPDGTLLSIEISKPLPDDPKP